MMTMNSIPQSLQSVLWSKDIKTLNLDHDAPYIVHQTLSHGTIDDIRWLFSIYPKEKITEIFVKNPYKDYRKARFLFIIKFFLHLSDKALDPRLYVANIPRAIR